MSLGVFNYSNTDDDFSENQFWLKFYGNKSAEILCAWGAFKETIDRAEKVCDMMHNTTALQINKNGSPKHPLYVKANIKRIPFKL